MVTIYLCFDNPIFYQTFIYVDYALTLIFVCELSFKIYSFKKSFFKGIWNIFDFVIISISAISLLLPLFGMQTEELNFLLIFRILRLIKFFRIVKIVPNLDKIFSDLRKAIKVTYGIVLGGFVILIILGVLLCSIFKNFAPENFSDPFVSIYTVFRLFSVEGWYEIPDAMCEKTSYFNATLIRITFSCLVLFGTFVFGFIISSISDELALDNNNELIKKTAELEGKIDNLNKKIDLLLNE